MISEVTSNYSQSTSTFGASTNSVQTTKDSKSEQVAPQGSQSTRTDTVEISTQARAAFSAGSKTSSQDTETEQSTTNLVQSADSQTASADTNIASVAMSKRTNTGTNTTPSPITSKSSSTGTGTGTGTGKSSSTCTSTTEPTALSGLSEQQMNKLVSDGTITSTQEKNELARRSAEKKITQASSKAQNNGVESYKQQKQSTDSISTIGGRLNYVA